MTGARPHASASPHTAARTTLGPQRRATASSASSSTQATLVSTSGSEIAGSPAAASRRDSSVEPQRPIENTKVGVRPASSCQASSRSNGSSASHCTWRR